MILNIGQCKSIDKAYKLVDTDYIFHCEDDWEFISSNVIEDSLKILREDTKIFSVFTLPYDNNANRVPSNHHPINPTIYNNSYKLLASFTERTNTWHGFTFNPTLRRTVDARIFSPYENHINSSLCNVGGIEQALNHLYHEKNFVFAIGLNTSGYVRHIGGGNPCPRNYH